ncbi:MAG: His/Gly/Thr/Pro-type tRNA ligase C-terminal domain-containing protein, partial [Verrucomicrobiota bacterium]
TQDDFVVRVSDRRAWQQKFTAAGITADQQYAAFQAIDKMEREPVEKTREKLAAVTPKVDEILAFAGQTTPDGDLKTVFDKLGDLAGYCQVDFKIVRGLAYYTGIVWEIHDRKGELRAIAGGGRYDNLLKLVSGVDLPALGFGMGDVVLGELLKERGLLPKPEAGVDCYFIIADEALRPAALKLAHDLRDAGQAVEYSLTPAKVGKQFQTASGLGARYAVVIGPEEWNTGQVKLKNLVSGVEMPVAIAELKEKLK